MQQQAQKQKDAADKKAQKAAEKADKAAQTVRPFSHWRDCTHLFLRAPM
jgi:hypothetical protein